MVCWNASISPDMQQLQYMDKINIRTTSVKRRWDAPDICTWCSDHGAGSEEADGQAGGGRGP